ncbi:hypothetical protein [Desulfobacula toluolica]|uniref:Phasin domain-containing protein n=1 Tax=Desulfobacula toluolica (strain DSM 7467 / Tol2) TaxID=651182 RepID=K0NP17_DESTT|nr:hypothetical protein [Desulfobacula toluolica]CCK81848.1 uncharacterized protein TOL2_C36910 [Desulfobacula toluolica Tol2]
MYSNKMFTQFVKCQKSLFDNSFAMMATLQDQGHQMMDKVFEKSPLSQGDSKKMSSYWVDFLKQNRENCKGYVDNGFDKIMDLLAEFEPVSSVNRPSEKASEKASEKTSKK